MSRLILIAAVRRVRDPGCRFDEMPVLEGTQGSGKSRALQVLAVEDAWFTNDLRLGPDTRQCMASTAGKWIVQVGELKAMSLTDLATLKAFLSRQFDEGRMAYEHKSTRVARQFVVVGTTNVTDDYLRETTSNRRFLPVRIQRFDLERLRADRDQLWAEAAEAEALGESIRLDPRLYEAAAEQEGRLAGDDLVEKSATKGGILTPADLDLVQAFALYDAAHGGIHAEWIAKILRAHGIDPEDALLEGRTEAVP
jgi:predicted P-loop ATPase